MTSEERALRRAEKRRDKEIRKIEEQQCEWNKIKKPTNVIINIFLAICSLVAVVDRKSVV